MATKTAKKKTASAVQKKTTKKVVAKKTTTKVQANAKKNSAKSVSTKSKTTVKKPASEIKKVTENKTESKSKSNISSKRRLSPFERIRSLHISNFITASILIVLTLVFVKPINKNLYLDYPANDSFVNSDRVTLDMATQSLFSLDMRYVLVAILGLSAIVSLLLATKLYKRYESSIKDGVSGVRWLMYGLVSVVLYEFVAILAGVQNLTTLKLVGGATLLVAVFAWIAERENISKKGHKMAFYGALLAFVLAILPIVANMVTVSLISGERFSWYVYVMFIGLFLGSVYSLTTLKSYITGRTKFEYVGIEQRYVRVDQIVKFLVVLCIFASFNK